MPEEAALYRKVRAAIAKKGGVGVDKVDCAKDLRDSPLYLTQVQIENLAPPFQEIAREWKPNASISQAETGKLKEVLTAYNLVGTRAGLAKRKCEDVPPLPSKVNRMRASRRKVK